MKQNSIIEIGGRVDVIVKFNSTTTINGKEYLANEPFLFLKDVKAEISYENNEKNATVNPKTYNANSEISPREILISGITFSKKIAGILSCLNTTKPQFDVTKMNTYTAEDGEIYLVDELDNTKPFFVYDENFEKINTTYDSVDNKLESIDFVEGSQYLVISSSAKPGTRFDLKKPFIPFMSIEIQGIGNIDKQTKKVFLFFGKVSLSTVMNLDFLEDTSINAPLRFLVLDGENYIVFGD